MLIVSQATPVDRPFYLMMSFATPPPVACATPPGGIQPFNAIGPQRQNPPASLPGPASSWRRSRRILLCSGQFTGMPDHGVRIIGLLVEMRAGGEFPGLRHRPCGSDDDTNARPAVMHLPSERQSVDGSRQVYVGEEQLHVGVRRE